MSTIRRCSLVLMILAGFTTSVSAQAKAPSGIPISSVSPAFAFSPVGRRVIIPERRSHWKEGGAIGATLLGIFGFVVGMAWCSDGDSSGENNYLVTGLGLGLMGAGVGFTVGSLIGAQVPRSQASAP